MLARCVATLKPPPELTLSQWADRYRMLSAESSAEPGRWHTDKAPYQREIMDAIGDAHIRRVVIMCAAQLGKTELLLNILGYFMAYACRKDKGSHKAAKRLQYWMCQVQRKPGPGWYCLKLDISKYFYRVNHEKLLAILGRRVKDPAMMAFIRGVVNSRAEPFGLPRWRTPQDTPPEEWLYEVGMPIGNLTSQLFANIYLNELDQYCKHKLKIHYYIRYMDDVIILGPDKETLHRWKAAVETFLREELALDLNSKTSIRPVRQGVEFVGVRIWPTHMKLRKSTVRRIKREVRKISALYAAGDMKQQDFTGALPALGGC